MYGMREDAAILIKALRNVADILSKNGYMHIADVYAKNGLQEALRTVETAKKNAPEEKPKLYSTGSRPYSRKGYITVRDRYVALGLMESAPEDLPLDLYSPEPVAWIGHKNAKIVLENVKTVMKFLRQYHLFLKGLPDKTAKEAIFRVARGERIPDILKRCILPCLQDGMTKVTVNIWLEGGAARLCGLTVVDMPPFSGYDIRAVDLDRLKISEKYEPSEMANLLLKKKRCIRWDGHLIEVLGKTVNGWKILRKLARLKPEIAVLIPP